MLHIARGSTILVLNLRAPSTQRQARVRVDASSPKQPTCRFRSTHSNQQLGPPARLPNHPQTGQEGPQSTGKQPTCIRPASARSIRGPLGALMPGCCAGSPCHSRHFYAFCPPAKARFFIRSSAETTPMVRLARPCCLSASQSPVCGRPRRFSASLRHKPAASLWLGVG